MLRGVDRLIKADIVGCFDNIDHALLNSTAQFHIGQGNESFCRLIAAFLTTDIRDKEGKSYASNSKGIPQGSPLSPILMNVFMHQFDLMIRSILEQEDKLRYVRYADDMLFGILQGVDSESVSQRFQKLFREALDTIKLEATSHELIRGTTIPCATLVLGVLVSIKREGALEMRAPIKRFKRKLNQALDNGIKEMQKKQLNRFLKLPRVFIYLSLYSCCCNAKEVLLYLKDLWLSRIKAFRQQCKGKEKEEKKIDLDRINKRLSKYHIKMKEKKQQFIEQELQRAKVEIS